MEAAATSYTHIIISDPHPSCSNAVITFSRGGSGGSTVAVLGLSHICRRVLLPTSIRIFLARHCPLTTRPSRHPSTRPCYEPSSRIALSYSRFGRWFLNSTLRLKIIECVRTCFESNRAKIILTIRALG